MATTSAGFDMATTGAPNLRPIGTTWCLRATATGITEDTDGVHVEPFEVHKLEVVFVRERPDGIHVAHAGMHRHVASPD